ncbi:putative semaphorin-6D-like isoform X5, partial [Apostichopus japonicus]
FYYQLSQCYACRRCSVYQIPNVQVKSGCRNFPYLCATENDVEPKANKFHPHNWPQLLGSFSENTSAWLVFFFHENGQPIIGKICMNESQYSQHDWRSYQKAFLQPNDSSDGIKYTHLEAVQLYDFSLPHNMSMYFAIFSNAGSEMAKSSAVCMIESKDIVEVFYSQKFKNETTGAEIEKRELPRPLGAASGRCGFISNDSEWLQDHPLMSDQVDCTATFEYEGRFLALETLEKLGPDGVLHKVIFIGTEDGRLLKFTLDGESFTFLMEEYFTNDSTIGITNLKVNFMYDERILNVSTSDGLHHQLGLQNCNKISNQCICEQDPFCIWSINRVECIEFFKDYDSQPISKKQCEGVNQHDALLVVDEYNRRKPEIPTTTIMTVDVTKAKTTVKPTKDAMKVESTSTVVYSLVLASLLVGSTQSAKANLA